MTTGDNNTNGTANITFTESPGWAVVYELKPPRPTILPGVKFRKVSGKEKILVKWSDGTTIEVACGDGERLDWEKGLAMCVVKKYFGNYTEFGKVLQKALDDNRITRKERKVMGLK